MTDTARTIDTDALRQLGFSEELIAEAVSREERGVLAIEPPADLVERTIAACAHLFPEDTGERKEAEDPLWAPFYPARPPEPDLYALVSRLSNQYMRSLGYAFASRERPLVMLDNHNLIEPTWWKRDPIFRCMRDAAGSVNSTVRNYGLDPSALVVVLRPDVRDYAKDELETIAAQVAEATSDVWWIPHDAAGPYADQDVVVLGEDSVLKIDGRAGTPLKAIAAMKTATDPTVVRQVRSDLLGYIAHATPVKVGGTLTGPLSRAELTTDVVRSALGTVISGAGLAA
jgi:hypothetical protein